MINNICVLVIGHIVWKENIIGYYYISYNDEHYPSLN
jgi:hypothetical protein